MSLSFRKQYFWLGIVMFVALNLFLASCSSQSLNSPSSQVPTSGGNAPTTGQGSNTTGQSSNGSTTNGPGTFTVSDTPLLKVTIPAGSAKIHTGSTHNIGVSITRNPDNDQVTSSQPNSGEVDVTVTESNNSQSSQGIELDITVPATSNITSSVQTGSLDIIGVSGVMNITGETMTVSFLQGTIKDKSTFSTRSGSISFSGALSNSGQYNFETQVGSINLTLPQNSSFALNADTEIGSVNNTFGSNTVGSNSNNQVTVHTTTGSINVMPGS